MYAELGLFVVFFLIVSVIFLSAAFYIAHTRLKRIRYFANLAVHIMDFFYKPILAIYMFIYKSPDKLHKKMTDLKNNAHRHNFKKTTDRIILAPHCMRHSDCKARTTRTGIQCTSCGKCDFAAIKALAEKYGYRLYIITGSSFVKHILKNPESKGTDGVLAIGCAYEINKGMREMKHTKLSTMGIPLLTSGCYNTKIDLKYFEEQLIAYHSASLEKESNIIDN
ncbi:MAG: DUF116 domain-containing protein [Methanimicrococcus sp.]|nr:DUF116 domain-containing protein [Methanimicrococcus sp.]